MNSASRQLGSPIKPIGVTGAFLTGFLALVLITLLSFLVNAKYSRRETVVGQVTPAAGSFPIQAQMNGLAVKVLVREGQQVAAGARLVSITADPVLRSGDTLAASLKSIQLMQRRAQEQNAAARAKQLETQLEEVLARRDGLQQDIGRLDHTTQLLLQRKHLQVENRSSYRKLAERGMVSAAAVRQQDDAYLSVLQQLASARRDADLQRSLLAQVLAQIRRLHADADLARSEAAAYKAQLDERELSFEAQHGAHLVSPINGIVTALTVRQGGSVVLGQSVAVVIPISSNQGADDMEVELFAPSRAVGFVRPGAKVRIMYDAFPYQTFGVGSGIVKEVSGTPLASRDLPLAIEGSEQLFRIRVRLTQGSLDAYGRDWPLVPGMRLNADLILEEQSLLEWILGPLRAVRKRAS